jgi:hypothetical protein
MANIIFELNDVGEAYKMLGTNKENVQEQYSNLFTPLVKRQVQFQAPFFMGTVQECWVLGSLAFYEIP